MKNSIRKNRPTLQPFETGQIWQMEDSHLEIGIIGKTLVHFKHYKGQVKRSPVSLLNKDALVKYLLANRAVLRDAAKQKAATAKRPEATPNLRRTSLTVRCA